jgi:hypothetical protein
VQPIVSTEQPAAAVQTTPPSWTEKLARLDLQEQSPPDFLPTEEPSKPSPSTNLRATYQLPLAAAAVEKSAHQIVSRQTEPIERQKQSKSKAEWDIDQWLRDPFGEQKSAPKVHPYLRPVEQVSLIKN